MSGRGGLWPEGAKSRAPAPAALNAGAAPRAASKSLAAGGGGVWRDGGGSDTGAGSLAGARMPLAAGGGRGGAPAHGSPPASRALKLGGGVYAGTPQETGGKSGAARSPRVVGRHDGAHIGRGGEREQRVRLARALRLEHTAAAAPRVASRLRTLARDQLLDRPGLRLARAKLLRLGGEPRVGGGEVGVGGAKAGLPAGRVGGRGVLLDQVAQLLRYGVPPVCGQPPRRVGRRRVVALVGEHELLLDAGRPEGPRPAGASGVAPHELWLLGVPHAPPARHAAHRVRFRRILTARGDHAEGEEGGAGRYGAPDPDALLLRRPREPVPERRRQQLLDDGAHRDGRVRHLEHHRRDPGAAAGRVGPAAGVVAKADAEARPLGRAELGPVVDVRRPEGERVAGVRALRRPDLREGLVRVQLEFELGERRGRHRGEDGLLGGGAFEELAHVLGLERKRVKRLLRGRLRLCERGKPRRPLVEREEPVRVVVEPAHKRVDVHLAHRHAQPLQPGRELAACQVAVAPAVEGVVNVVRAELPVRHFAADPPKRGRLHQQMVLVLEADGQRDAALLDPVDLGLRPPPAATHVGEPAAPVGRLVQSEHAQQQPRVPVGEGELAVDEAEAGDGRVEL
eukprot:scaffold25045_cov90-Isochrysis_galbana.AAC.4